MNFSILFISLLFLPTTYVLATTCIESLNPKVLLELQKLRQSIYLTNSRAEGKITQAAFEKKVLELASTLKTSKEELLAQLNELPTSVIMMQNQKPQTTSEKIIELFEKNYPRYDLIKSDTLKLLNSLVSKNITLEEYWEEITTRRLTTHSALLESVLLIAHKDFFIKECIKANSTINALYIDALITNLDFNKIAIGSEPALYYAIKHEDIPLIKALVLLGANINATVKDRDNGVQITFLQSYLRYVNFDYEVVQTLVSLNADTTVKKKSSDLNLLHLLAKREDPYKAMEDNMAFHWMKAAELLVQINPVTWEQTKEKHTPFRSAVIANTLYPWKRDWFAKHGVRNDNDKNF